MISSVTNFVRGWVKVIGGVFRIKELLKKEEELKELGIKLEELNTIIKPAAGVPSKTVEEYITNRPLTEKLKGIADMGREFAEERLREGTYGPNHFITVAEKRFKEHPSVERYAFNNGILTGVRNYLRELHLKSAGTEDK